MRRRNEPCELNPIFVLHILKWIKRSVSGMEPKEWKHDEERAISKDLRLGYVVVCWVLNEKRKGKEGMKRVTHAFLLFTQQFTTLLCQPPCEIGSFVRFVVLFVFFLLLFTIKVRVKEWRTLYCEWRKNTTQNKP